MAKYFDEKMHFLEIFLVFAHFTWQNRACTGLLSFIEQKFGLARNYIFSKYFVIG